MKSECFLDTNILIYATAGRLSDPRKFDVARGIIENRAFGLSGQVLAEFYVNFTRKAVTSTPQAEADHWINVLTRFPVVPLDETLVRAGIVMARRYQIHYYDGAILAAAERLGAPVLYTEDLSHGQRYGSVLVENPFRQP